MTAALKLWDCERRNAAGEVAVFKGQGTTQAEADKEGWENACADFGPSSSGAPPIARAQLAVILPDGRRVTRTPKAFLSGPYDPREFVPHPNTMEDKRRMQEILSQ